MATKDLIVEDETNIAELLHLSYLEKEGFETAVAGDGGKAVESSAPSILNWCCWISCCR